MAAGALRLLFMGRRRALGSQERIVKPDVGRCSVRAREERESTRACLRQVAQCPAIGWASWTSGSRADPMSQKNLAFGMPDLTLDLRYLRYALVGPSWGAFAAPARRSASTSRRHMPAGPHSGGPPRRDAFRENTVRRPTYGTRRTFSEGSRHRCRSIRPCGRGHLVAESRKSRRASHRPLYLARCRISWAFIGALSRSSSRRGGRARGSQAASHRPRRSQREAGRRIRCRRTDGGGPALAIDGDFDRIVNAARFRQARQYVPGDRQVGPVERQLDMLGAVSK